MSTAKKAVPTKEQAVNAVANIERLFVGLPIPDYKESTIKGGGAKFKNPDLEGAHMAANGMVVLEEATDQFLRFTVHTDIGRQHVIILSAEKNTTDPEAAVWMRKIIQNKDGKMDAPKNYDLRGTKLDSASKLECAVRHFVKTQLLTLVENNGDNSMPRRILNLLRVHPAVMLRGWVGCGKTHNLNLAYDLLCAEFGNWKYFTFTGNEGATGEDMLLTIVPGSNSPWDKFPGVVAEAFEAASKGEQVFLYIDEINRFNMKVQSLFIQALNLLKRPGFKGYRLHNHLNQQVFFANTDWAQREKGIIRVVSSVNIGEPGTNEMGPALMRRFGGNIYMYYLPAEKEAALVQKETGGALPIKTCKGMVSVANKIRQMYKDMQVACPLDTGSVIDWGMTVADRIAPTPEIILEAASETWLYKVTMYDANGVPNEASEDSLKRTVQSVFGS